MWWRNSRLNRIEKKIECLAEISEQTNQYIYGFLQKFEKQDSTIQLNYGKEQEKIQGRLNHIEATLQRLSQSKKLIQRLNS